METKDTKKTYWHTEDKGSHATKRLNVGQLRRIGDRTAILLRRDPKGGQWVIGWYRGDGQVEEAEMMAASELVSGFCRGRVLLTAR